MKYREQNNLVQQHLPNSDFEVFEVSQTQFSDFELSEVSRTQFFDFEVFQSRDYRL
jgi:hypothetical protein